MRVEQLTSNQIDRSKPLTFIFNNKKYKGFVISFLIVFPKLCSAVFKIIFYLLLMNREKKEIYYQRYSGLVNAIMGKSSWYRPKV